MSTEDRAYEIRELALELALRAGTCHIGSALGIADILAVAYFDAMGEDDTFILSKAHAGSALMATLALRGTVDREQLLREYCQDGGAFGGHAERGVPGVEISGGSLGHGHQGLEIDHAPDRWVRLEARFAAAGWEVAQVDGHDHAALRAALSAAGAGRPRLVVAHTIKGRGVSFMEGRFDSHYKSVRPHDRERVMGALAEGRLAA